MKIAIAHDWLTNMGGAEQCVMNFERIFRDAPVYTLLYNPKKIAGEINHAKIITSFLQKFPGHKWHTKFLPLMPMAWEMFDFSDYDIVLSSTSCCAKGIITKANTTHICYCYTPIRYAWEKHDEYSHHKCKIIRLLINLLMHYIRLWDFDAAQRVDYFIAISTAVQKRIRKFYGRDSVVIFPPVRCSQFTMSDIDGDYYLVVSRLVGYKRFDLAVAACTALNRKLIVIGDGPQKADLEKIAGPSVTFMGRQSDEVVERYMAECKALLFPGEEDFGIVPVEAEACGRPVIAYGVGGAVDTVLDGKTGVLFKEQTVDSLVKAIKRFETMAFDKNEIREHALQFDETVFQKKIKEFVESKISSQIRQK